MGKFYYPKIGVFSVQNERKQTTDCKKISRNSQLYRQDFEGRVNYTKLGVVYLGIVGYFCHRLRQKNHPILWGDYRYNL
jgi:hypothetical protein